MFLHIVCNAGHSLGGAVALLCTLRLLRSLKEPSPLVQCICFGTPAIGNAALAAMVHEHGWEDHILNFILPGQATYCAAHSYILPRCNTVTALRAERCISSRCTAVLAVKSPPQP